MRLAIISDTHLGKRQYRTEEGFINKYEKAGYDAFDKNIDLILENNPDMILMCGDIFDVANPTILALEKFRSGLDRLKHIPSLIILGNHDFHFNNKHLACSSVETLLSEDYNIKKFADYNVEYYIQDNVLFVLLPYVYDKLENLQSMWKECSDLADQYKDYHKILVAHGITETYSNMFPEFGEKFVIPDKVVKQFNEVFIGHIHTPFELRTGNTLVVSPGALIDYQAYELRTGPVFYDTETGKLERKLVDTPYIKKVILNEQTINNFLEDVGPYIYNITYNGDTSKINNDLFIEAKRKAVNLVLTLAKNETEEIEKELDTNFYSWLAEHYKDKIQIFNQAKEEIRL